MAKSGQQADIGNGAGNGEVVGQKRKFDLAAIAKILALLAGITASILAISSNVRSMIFGGGEKGTAPANAAGPSPTAPAATPPPPPPRPPPPPVVRIETAGGTMEIPSAGPIRVEQLPHGGSRTIVCPAGYALEGDDCIPPPSQPPRPPNPPPPPPLPPPLPPPPTCPDCAPPPPIPTPCASGPFIVFFDWDRDQITPQAAAILDNAAAAYQACGPTRVWVGGHADRSGPADYNVGLSQARADGVRAHLAGQGIADDLIATRAFGESRPLVETSDGVREPQNRRVEVTFGPAAGW